MRSNQIVFNLLDGAEIVEKVVNMDQVKFAQAGEPVTVDQVEYETTLLTLIDSSQETAIVDFIKYKEYFQVTDTLIFDANLIPVQP